MALLAGAFALSRPQAVADCLVPQPVGKARKELVDTLRRIGAQWRSKAAMSWQSGRYRLFAHVFSAHASLCPGLLKLIDKLSAEGVREFNARDLDAVELLIFNQDKRLLDAYSQYLLVKQQEAVQSGCVCRTSFQLSAPAHAHAQIAKQRV